MDGIIASSFINTMKRQKWHQNDFNIIKHLNSFLLYIFSSLLLFWVGYSVAFTQVLTMYQIHHI
jgi:hypothetical protein